MGINVKANVCANRIARRAVGTLGALTLLTLAFVGDSPRKADELLTQVRQELEAVRPLLAALAANA